MSARTSKLRPVKADQGEPADAHVDPTENIRLTGDRILVRVPGENERRSKGSLLIPATASAPIKRCAWSEVALVGPDTRNVKPGDQVLFIPQSGLEVDVRGEIYLLLRERDIQAIASNNAIASDGLDRSGQYL